MSLMATEKNSFLGVWRTEMLYRSGTAVGIGVGVARLGTPSESMDRPTLLRLGSLTRRHSTDATQG